MLDKNFDHIIKRKVEESTPKMPPSDWKSLAGLLGHVPSAGMEDTAFDAVIKNKVTSAQPVIPPSDWSLMRNALANDLGKLAGSDSSGDAGFDQEIYNKVAQANPPIPPSNWNALAGKLGHGPSGASDAAFDQIIKQKVIDATPIIPGAAWGLMADKLGHETPQAIDAFDQVIKSKVDNANIDIPTPDWSQLSQDLGHSPDAQFDQVILDKVSNAQIAIPPSNWNDLSVKLGHTTKDQLLDNSLKGKVSNASVPFNESHWTILRDQLRKTAQLRKRLYSIKIFESLLAILLFWTFANYSDYLFAPSQMQDKDIIEIAEATNQDVASQTIQSEASTNNQNELTSNKVVNNSNDKVEVARSSSTTNVQKENLLKASSAILAETTSKTTESIVPNSSNDGGSNSGLYNGNNSDFLGDVNNNNNSAPSLVGYSNDSNESSESSQNDTSTDMNASDSYNSTLDLNGNKLFNFEPIDLVNKLVVSIQSSEAPKMNLGFDEVQVEPIKEANSFHGTHLHAIVGYNINSIDSPQDPVFPIRAYQALSENLNFELRFSKSFNYIELGTGLQFQKVTYMPRAINETLPDPTRYLSLAKINYSIVSIPTFARLHHKAAKNLTIFADLGVTANAIGWTKYDITEVIENGDDDLPPAPISSVAEAENDNSRLFMKDFASGLFESNLEDFELQGQFSNSVYMTLNSGVGVQYLFSDQFGLYSRLNIDQGLGNFKFGPNLDDINTYGLQLGLRYKL